MLSFKVFTFPPGQDFVPSKETKNFWLYTKKSKRTFGGVVLPGLFETVGYSTQMIFFFAILLLEAVPTVYGVEQGVMWEAIVTAIFIDIALALTSHLWHDQICWHQNELVNEDSQVKQEALRRAINRYRFYTYFFYVLIITSGALKFYFFYDAYMVPDVIAGGVLVCYLAGAVLHIAYTGYFLYTSRFNYKIQSEYSRYVSSGGKTFKDRTGTIQQPLFAQGAFVQVKPVSAGNQRILKAEDEQYAIETTGVLTDYELADMIVKQPFDAQGFIARKGLQRQMEILQTN